ncbi:MAG: HU family DNA-binding protein [Proteobacteria bacterium]|nr:HU family DNA-binding protein [Pseudomonadota bacterium]
MHQAKKPITLTKHNLIESINKKTNFNAKQAAKIVHDIINILSESILSDEIIEIEEFGSLTIRNKGMRIGRNPKTMVETVISPRKIVRFNASKTLRNMINSNINNKLG